MLHGWFLLLREGRVSAHRDGCFIIHIVSLGLSWLPHTRNIRLVLACCIFWVDLLTYLHSGIARVCDLCALWPRCNCISMSLCVMRCYIDYYQHRHILMPVRFCFLRHHKFCGNIEFKRSRLE
ncbi:hypothetical protein C2E23DRAFT_745268, partial [Lenzites betulinus]